MHLIKSIFYFFPAPSYHPSFEQNWIGDFHNANQDHWALCPSFDLLPMEKAGSGCHAPCSLLTHYFSVTLGR